MRITNTMYSSRSLSIDTFAPWRSQTTWTKRVHETSANQNQPHNQPHNIHSLASAPTEIPPEAVQSAPPLAAYSADHCGSSVMYTEYNRAVQLMAFSGSRDIPLLSPHTSKRLDTLRRIKATGYETISPIGINKTMRQLDEEAHPEEEDGQTLQAENSMAATTTAADTSNSLRQTSSDSPVASAADQMDGESSDLLQGMDRDMDALVEDADANDSGDFEAGFESDTPDAFMAEDVEYQNDHSLGLPSLESPSLGATSLSASLGTSSLNASLGAASFGAASLTTRASDILSAPSESTLATGPTSLQNCEGSDVDMTLEY